MMLGYMCSETREGKVEDGHGKIIGEYRIVSSWRTPNSWVSSRMFQLVVKDKRGYFYIARSPGKHMHILGKRKAQQSWD